MKHPVPSITATMKEMPERHTWSIQFHPLLPQWREGTREEHPVPSIIATMEEMPERHALAGQIMVSLDILCDRPYVVLSSSSIHYRHNGGDAKKTHVKHPVPSITATMEGRHT